MATTAGAAPAHPPITILKRQRQDLPISQNKFLKKTARGKVLQCMLSAPSLRRLLTI